MGLEPPIMPGCRPVVWGGDAIWLMRAEGGMMEATAGLVPGCGGAMGAAGGGGGGAMVGGEVVAEEVGEVTAAAWRREAAKYRCWSS